jgi:regulator of cell morphogenesis and NO signaling
MQCGYGEDGAYAMNLTGKPLREIVAEQPAAAQIFERFSIDICGMGDETLAGACARLSLSAEQLEEKLASLESAEDGDGELAIQPLRQIIQRVVRVHHRKVRQDLPALAQLAATLGEKHAGRKVEFATLGQMIGRLHMDLLEHIGREEQVLFPLIARMEDDRRMNYPEAQATFRSLKAPMAKMKQNHDAARQIIVELRDRTNDFEPDRDACARHRALFSGLRGFAEDLHDHIHLEDDILVPRALKLEAELQSGRAG